MGKVRAKKFLGQHFLADNNIAEKIARSLTPEIGFNRVLEVGPGMGVLTQFLLTDKAIETWVIELDRDSVAYLKEHYPDLTPRIIEGDFLRLNLQTGMEPPFAVIGNFPYNISSQILFRVIEHRDRVPQLVGMFQKEVAERMAADPGNKTYGILSVLAQAWFKIEYLFTVHEHVFNPPPKVKSAVVRLTRNDTTDLGCDEKLFVRVVKAGFNQRRKTLRNAVKSVLMGAGHTTLPFMDLRAERLSVADFVVLTNAIAAVLPEKP